MSLSFANCVQVHDLRRSATPLQAGSGQVFSNASRLRAPKRPTGGLKGAVETCRSPERRGQETLAEQSCQRLCKPETRLPGTDVTGGQCLAPPTPSKHPPQM